MNQRLLKMFAFILVQNGLADSSWPGTAGALVPGYKGPGPVLASSEETATTVFFLNSWALAFLFIAC